MQTTNNISTHKVFHLLDTPVPFLVDEIIAAMAADGFPAVREIEVHDGQAFAPLPSGPLHTRYPFLLLRIRLANADRVKIAYSTLGRGIYAYEESELSTWLHDVFVQARAGVSDAEIFTHPEDISLRPLLPEMTAMFQPARDQLNAVISGAEIVLIPSCWVRYREPEEADALCVDADSYAWVSPNPHPVYGQIAQRLGAPEAHRAIMVSAHTILNAPLTPIGILNLLLHETAHHLDTQSKSADEASPHHGFWFHVVFLILLRLVYGRSLAVLVYIEMSLRGYAEQEGADPFMPDPERAAAIAQMISDALMEEYADAAGIQYDDLVSKIADIRADKGDFFVSIPLEEIKMEMHAMDWVQDDDQIFMETQYIFEDTAV